MPSGVWAEDEYAKLPGYDGDIGAQAVAGAVGVFLCHQQDGRICAGWAGCHDMDESLAIRLASSAGFLVADELDAVFDYRTDVPLFASGAEAAEHGLADLMTPGADAVRTITRLERKLDVDDPYRKRYGEVDNRDEGGTR